MRSSDSLSIFNIEDFKEIEDVIDARKRLGHYNVINLTNALKKVHSSSRCQPDTGVDNKPVKFEELSGNSSTTSVSGITRTDSEITIFVLRAKCNSKRKTKWSGMNDIAIPGDGTHLGDSPSLVNLATLVTQNAQAQCEGEDEYLVPLSSWEPYTNTDDIFQIRFFSETSIHEKRAMRVRTSHTDSNLVGWNMNKDDAKSDEQAEFDEEEMPQASRSSWSGRFSKFWRKQWRKRKILASADTVDNAGIDKEQQH